MVDRCSLTVSTLCACMLFLGAGTMYAQDAAPHLTPSQSVPDWLTWKVFYESIDHYGSLDRLELEHVLSTRFAIEPGQLPTLLQAGRRYLDTLDGIDAGARRSVQARYAVDWPPGQRPHGAAASERPILLQPGQTLLDMVKADGLFQLVEQQKHQALRSHMDDLRAIVTARTIRTIQRWNESMIGPRVRSFSAGNKIDALPSVPKGAAALADTSRKER